MKIDINFELAQKKWVRKSDTEYEQDLPGWRPFYLHFIESENQWRLKQWGLGYSILTVPVLDEETLPEIFAACSRYAKKLPW